MTLKLLGKIIWQTFEWVVLLGGVLGILSGVLLMFDSPLFFRINERMSRWISTRQAMRPLEKPIEIEHAVYRWHRVFGVLILAGALFALYAVAFRFKGPELSFVMARFFRIEVANWLGQSLRIFLIVVNAAAALIAAIMILRPSALKPLEAWANRRYSGRPATRAWEIPRTGPDPIVQAYPRLVGAALCVMSAFILISVGYARLLGL